MATLTSYTLGEAQITQNWSTVGLLRTSQDNIFNNFSYACTKVFELTEPGGTPLPPYFSDTRGVGGSNTFKVLYSEDPAFIGEWRVQLKAYFYGHEEHAVLSDEYRIVVSDPCDPPTMTPMAAQSFAYVITDNIGASHQADLTTAFANFYASVSPSFCYSRIEYRNDDVDTASAFSFDSATDTFSINKLTDLELLGSNKASVTKTVYFDMFYGYECADCVRGFETVAFSITLKNPCVDRNYVAIQTLSLPTTNLIV